MLTKKDKDTLIPDSTEPERSCVYERGNWEKVKGNAITFHQPNLTQDTFPTSETNKKKRRTAGFREGGRRTGLRLHLYLHCPLLPPPRPQARAQIQANRRRIPSRPLRSHRLPRLLRPHLGRQAREHASRQGPSLDTVTQRHTTIRRHGIHST
jgi:hypothetical protein